MREIKFRVWNNITNKWIIPKKECFVPINNSILLHGDYYRFQQYTEVKDKNGKEIYEGDFLKYGNRRGIVEFFAGMFICSWADQTDDTLAFMQIANMEIVGNIFETPQIQVTDKISD